MKFGVCEIGSTAHRPSVGVCQAAAEVSARHVDSTGLQVGSNTKNPLPSGTSACSGFRMKGLVRELGSATAVAGPAVVAIVTCESGPN